MQYEILFQTEEGICDWEHQITVWVSDSRLGASTGEHGMLAPYDIPCGFIIASQCWYVSLWNEELWIPMMRKAIRVEYWDQEKAEEIQMCWAE